MMNFTTANWRRILFLAPLLLASLGSCSPELFLNNFASLGGDTPGGRGVLEIVFDNQTQSRAIFTFGIYDPQDQTSKPTYGQFVVDAAEDATEFNRGLPAMTTTTIGSFTPSCGRLISFGGEQMIARIKAKDLKTFNSAPTVEAAFRTGIYFTNVPLDDTNANANDETSPNVIHIDAVNSYLGTDYECDARLVYQFVPDPNDPANVLVNLSVIPASADQ